MEDEVQMMIHGEGFKPMPVRNWRKCPLIQASRKAEFRPIPADMAPEIRRLPEHVRTSLNGCKLFQLPQIAEYNNLLRRDGKLVSGVDKLYSRGKTKPGRLYHKFDSLCALATSKAGRLLLVQHRALNHVFYALGFHSAHNLYNDMLNKYERRWYSVSETYGKEGTEEDEAHVRWRVISQSNPFLKYGSSFRHSSFRHVSLRNYRKCRLNAEVRISEMFQV